MPVSSTMTGAPPASVFASAPLTTPSSPPQPSIRGLLERIVPEARVDHVLPRFRRAADAGEGLALDVRVLQADLGVAPRTGIEPVPEAAAVLAKRPRVAGAGQGRALDLAAGVEEQRVAVADGAEGRAFVPLLA